MTGGNVYYRGKIFFGHKQRHTHFHPQLFGLARAGNDTAVAARHHTYGLAAKLGIARLLTADKKTVAIDQRNNMLFHHPTFSAFLFAFGHRLPLCRPPAHSFCSSLVLVLFYNSKPSLSTCIYLFQDKIKKIQTKQKKPGNKAPGF